MLSQKMRSSGCHIVLLAACHLAWSGVWRSVFQNKPINWGNSTGTWELLGVGSEILEISGCDFYLIPRWNRQELTHSCYYCIYDGLCEFFLYRFQVSARSEDLISTVPIEGVFASQSLIKYCHMASNWSQRCSWGSAIGLPVIVEAHGAKTTH